MPRLEQRLAKIEQQNKPIEIESLDGLPANEQWRRICDQGRHPARNTPAISAAEAWAVVSASLKDDDES
jgi:hypothetical protein